MRQRIRAFFLAPLRASLTAECAVALPVFLICCLAVIHLCNVEHTALRFGNAMTQTAEEMAVGAYVSEYGEENSLLNVVLSAAWARGRIMEQTGSTEAVRNANFLLSSFRSHGEMIDIVLTYQIRLPVGMIKAPASFWVQRSAVRAWVGRAGSGAPAASGEEEEDESPIVYVAENGEVYHTDPNCTHIHLSILKTAITTLSWQRNKYGAKYHACEICGSHAEGEVYITLDGNRYHSSLTCPGLKRTIHETHLSEVGDLRPCSRCGG